MRAWEIGPRGGIENLRLVEREDPVAGPGEILVRVIGAGLNYRDLMILRGHYGNNLPEDRIPLTDGVGIIEALGDGVEGFAVGDRIVAANFVDWDPETGFGYHIFGRDIGVTMDGWLAEKIVLPAKAAIKVPDTVDDATAATLAVVACTVWHAMVAFGGAGPGKLVLAQGTGGVSIFALQLAKALGAQFAITSSSDEKLAKARELGADYTANYRERADWAAALLEATGGRGADVVVDTIGFGDFAQTLEATGLEGRIGTLGALSGSPQDNADFAQGPILGKNITIKGITSGHRGVFEQALAVIADKGVKTLVDRQFAFDDAAAAYRHLESGGHMGKVMVRVEERRKTPRE
ncbi:NAD(P)-dependent alcohol dehydrogenase [Erythrobacter sp. JK5]|uniref:zinc-dependent alcohol dehydrogenase family protein n=1 Tax=Erythrobacter sp. JK5 TaxID=2829500 RepID=UPI001BA9F713|nr:NAD(P)-dependent alcohol dehydrogenase [Erythrobacter sp. JK5]QUL36982.1 NAD(P)-dependent alcohol dehydrogenase [Erythrobacter sp. JK5]